MLVRNFVKLRKKSFEINKPDFIKAMEERNFEAMSDIYNEMMRYDDLATINASDRHIFTEILDKYTIKLPLNAFSAIKSMGKDFYYTLSDISIMYDIDNYPTEGAMTDISYDYLKSENIEADKIELTGDTITFTPMAVKTLDLNVGNIIEIEIFDDESFILSKFERQFYFN